MVRVGVDVGGTFTDLVALVDGDVVTAKVPTTPSDQSDGVMRCIKAAGIETRAVTALAHGMTVATNALLERRGARTALVTTKGFRDLLEIGRQNRPSLYDLTQDRPPQLIPRELRFTVQERMGVAGELEALDAGELELVVKELADAGVEAVAVCFLWAFRHPDHEQRAGEAIRRALPGVHVSLSSEVLPEFREYERLATTAADAYLGPKLRTYLNGLSDKVTGASLPPPLVMQSSGGVIGIEAAAANAASCVLSGPAGGVVGAAHAAGASGYGDLVTFDMGGTSTDVAPVVGGRVQTTTESLVAGVPIKLPMVDVHTVSAGGGSIAWIDEGGALRVGPHSAGADPGPASYGRGGREPTVTDANLFLGYLADGARLGGELDLERDHAEAALARLGARLGLKTQELALGIVEVANAEMARALRVITVERGLDPRDFVLVAFGGAGPMHACALAEELAMDVVLVPRASGVLSALGLAISDVRRDYVIPFLEELGKAEASRVSRTFEELELKGAGDLEGAEFQRRADLRYKGQSFELTVDAGDLGGLEPRWHEAHEQRYGYRIDDAAVEIVNLRVTATVGVDVPRLEEAAASGRADAGARGAIFDEEWQEVPVVDRTRMGRGSKVAGPALIEFPDATCVVRPGWAGAVDNAGTLVLERARD